MSRCPLKCEQVTIDSIESVSHSYVPSNTLYCVVSFVHGHVAFSLVKRIPDRVSHDRRYS